MRYVHYTKYYEAWDDLPLEDLLERLSDFLLQSGFHDFYSRYNPTTDDLTMQDLYDMLMDEMSQWEETNNLDENQMRELIQYLMKRMVEEGYIRPDQELFSGERGQEVDPKQQPDLNNVKFELTDKSIDFLGFKKLKDLLGAVGRSSLGRHDTHYLSTGVETSEAPKKYEFGDTLNLDISSTLLNCVRRSGLKIPFPLEADDLMVQQSEYQSSCATVLMLDCSHSMILYGEDRFTPAKQVALALAHLIRTQYPGDSFHVVLFHDSAEQIPLKKLATVKVGPYYTNTRDGFILAQRILARERKDMKQIIMITDGKPSAITMENGRVYRNAFGLDPMIVNSTFQEAAKCRKSGILINTFMLASDCDLVAFVKKLTEMCRGKAYFTTPYNVGEYILFDYLNRKTSTRYKQ
ncbi:MAG TPA: VWA domain-containing protein [Acidobacteriota bacterium]|nr:VWA domain-containing protein [Acidobacteriota bacterium]